MKYPLIPLHLLLLSIMVAVVNAETFKVQSPDRRISATIENGSPLQYAVEFKGRKIVSSSPLGFEFRNEPAMTGGFAVTEHSVKEIREEWIPVVRLKHEKVINHYNELHLALQEDSGLHRKMDLWFRLFNDGVAFRYQLYRSEAVGNREIVSELTSFNIPENPTSWIVEYGGYASSQESEFMEFPLSHVTPKTIAGLPLLMEYGDDCWVAITEANIDNYSAFYLGTDGTPGHLVTKLAPGPGDSESDAKVRFDDDLCSPWRVLMIGDSPGTLIESEIIRNLNEPCAIEDTSWIEPGKSAWDHWWSGDVKMEMPVIKEYIDFASAMEWKYMLVDWQWYGKFNKSSADITTWAPQIDIPEVIAYAAEKNVKIILWLYSKDVNRNSAYKKAFPLYRQWGAAGVKIDFMDRDDQEMVNWYHDIIRCAADNRLLVDFHGAYKPDGIIRTYPNMITREGVMGNEYYKFSSGMSPEHNVKLAYTRQLAGPMDYTPGAFLNVTKEQFKNGVPAVVWNTRAAELSKFVIYESPLTVVCDHPDHILNQPGEEFIKAVPVEWDDTRFLGGHPSEYVAIARRNGAHWYIGVMNNSVRKKVDVVLNFLPDGDYVVETWEDKMESDVDPKIVGKRRFSVKGGDTIAIELARNGGFVARIAIREK